jgi:hypothetical protein
VVKTGKGAGVVSVTPPGPDFPAGTLVNLTAVPGSRSTFAGWRGACTGIAPACKIIINSNKTVSAAFEPRMFTISATSGQGGTISPAGQVRVGIEANQFFRIEAAPRFRIADVVVVGGSLGPVGHHMFTGVMGDHTIRASFTPIVYSLRVTVSGRGKGSVTAEPPGNTLRSGTVVTLTATPDRGSIFE